LAHFQNLVECSYKLEAYRVHEQVERLCQYMEKTKPVGFRFRVTDLQKLKEQAEQQKISRNALVQKLVQEHLRNSESSAIA
jgi:predicted HicB family RNase H-like nuclease